MRDKYSYLMRHRLKHFIKLFVNKSITSAMALGTGWKDTDRKQINPLKTLTLQSDCFTELELLAEGLSLPQESPPN